MSGVWFSGDGVLAVKKPDVSFELGIKLVRVGVNLDGNREIGL